MLVCTETVASGSWLEKITTGYKEVETRIIDGYSKDEQPQQLVAAKPLPTSSPNDWYYSYFNEPVFNSQIVVLEAGSKHKETIMLVHGLGELGMKDWFDVIPLLTTDYNVLAIDLPGFGLSGVPKGRYSPTHYAEVLEAVLNEYVDKPITLIGHSMGGAVSLRFSSIYPERVKQLILVDAAGILEKTAFVKHLSSVPSNESVVPDVFQKTLAQVNDFGSSLIELGTLNDPASDFLQSSDTTWNLLLSNSPNMNAALSLVEENFNLAVRELEVKTTVIWGENDRVAPLRTAKVLSANIDGATLAVIEGAAHVPMKTHTLEFINTVKQAINSNVPIVTNYEFELTQGDLVCNGKSNVTYSGKYDAIVLNQCTNIKLQTITAKSLEVNDSLVEAENLTLMGPNIALKAKESVLRITNGTIKGNKAILLSGSRLDLAGVDISGDDYAIYSDKHSQVVLSICKSGSELYTGLAHGVYEVTETTLDGLLSL